ncbi:hypothetical protein [Desulfosporosinus sp. SB140]|uniref:hypothetical protein n=1 Tax=Desulfosporosinus paludis TaxID=3115649 RepID=UPI00388D052B
MIKKVMTVVMILMLGLVLVGCGNSSGKTQPQNTTGANQASSVNAQQNTAASQDSKLVHLTPIPQGTPLVTANNQVSKQLMTQKDVLGTQIYEQKGIVYGNITFKSGVAKDYAHELANEFLTQLKVNYPKRQITTQVVIDGKTTDSIAFKP